MRSLLAAVIGLTFLACTSAAQAKISIVVDKNAQQMTVEVDGVQRYRWPVSTGNPSHETPNGSFRTFRMERDHYSKEFDEAPMPHAIFFTKSGHAIHGTDSVRRLGSPASHGCVRLSRANASTLYALVERDGVLNTTVKLTGSSQIALARNPRLNNTIARRAVAPQMDANGDPVMLAPQQGYPRQVAPQARTDETYIYPSDAYANYPAPRDYRRQYDAQAPQQYYDNRGYYQQPYAPQGYAPQPYYQQRRLYTYQE
jgi:hypothetical protein